MKKLRLLTIAVLALFTGLAAFAQSDGPEDITDQYLTNAGLSTKQYGSGQLTQNEAGGWEYGDPFNGGTFEYTDWVTNGDVPVIEFYHTWSGNAGATVSPTKNFHFTQTITLPAGNYRLAVNGFYREGNGNGTNTKAYIFAGEKQQYLEGLSSAGIASYTGGSDLLKAANAFSRGDFSNEFDFDLEEEQEITIGFRGYIDTYCSWCILGPVKLYKYSLEDYLVAYREKVAEAEALYSSPMNAQVLQDLQVAVLPESSFNLANEITAQITILNQKIAAANTSIQNYENALAVINAASTLTANGQADYAASTIIQEIQAAYDARTLVALSDEQIAAAKEALAAAVKEQTEVGADYTPAAPTDWVLGNGVYQGRTERYNPKDGISQEYDGDVMYQMIEGVPSGAYKVTLEATASYTSGRNFDGKTGNDLAVVFANNSNVNLPVVDRGAINDVSEYGPHEVIGKVGSDGVLKYGIKKLDPLGGNWFVVNLVSITKVEYVPVESITADDVEMEIATTSNISAVVNPGNATFPDITYSSAEETIATVDAEGVVTGVAVGQTTITITADEVSKTINVTVTAPAIVPENITLDPSTITLKFGGTTTATITAAVSPAEANQEVTFESSDPTVATVDADGNVTATGIGSATITVTSAVKEDVVATATVTVSSADAPNTWTSLSDIQNGRNYWLYNAATGKYFGGANSWGTHASLIEHGIPFKFTKAGEGIYTLDSYTSNGGDSHFVNGEWIDQGATNLTFVANNNGTVAFGITNADGTTFLQANSTDTNVYLTGTDNANPFAQWYLLSMDNRIQNLENGSDTDATFFIKDFNFSRNNQMISSWETSYDGQTFRPGQEGRPNDGDQFNWNYESWHSTFSIAQTIVVPNGTYKLTAQGFYEGTENENPPFFFANDEQRTFLVKNGNENNMHTAAVSFSAGKYTIEPITVTVTDHILTIGAKNEVNKTGLWCIWDNFNLEAVSLDEDQDLAVTLGNVKGTGYGTMYYGKFNTTPKDATAYIVTLNGNKATTVEIPTSEGIVIPAGTAVMLQGAPGETKLAIIYDDLLESEKSDLGENVLKGTDDETTIEESGHKYYMLSTGKTGKLGFYYHVPGGGSIVNGAHKAYIDVEEENAASFYLLFDDADGISNVIATENSGEVYTISGVRVNGQLQKGVYIMNGKKVIIK